MGVSMNPGVCALLFRVSWPRAASLVPGEVILQGSSRCYGFCNAVLSWGVKASSLSIARKEGSGKSF